MLKLSKKFVEVMKECNYIAKNGIVSIATPTVLEMQDVTTAKGKIEYLAIVEITVTLTGSESGETMIFKGLGSGQDAGDKALMKAQTAALKYCYLLSLSIATGDDPEADTSTDESTVTPIAPSAVKNPARNALVCHDCGASQNAP